mmetsp:Transcript_27758/g.44496  ORF Transcript_27758/g.44496 Transcript_27758/m.44496 type:complete len:341 (-) Transcript_27758:38-1060(-)
MSFRIRLVMNGRRNRVCNARRGRISHRPLLLGLCVEYFFSASYAMGAIVLAMSTMVATNCVSHTVRSASGSTFSPPAFVAHLLPFSTMTCGSASLGALSVLRIAERTSLTRPLTKSGYAMPLGGVSCPCEKPSTVRSQIPMPNVSASAAKIARSELSTRQLSSRSIYTTACTSRSFSASFTLASPRALTWSPSSRPGVSSRLRVNPAAVRPASSGRKLSGWNGADAATRSLSTELSVELLPDPCLPTNTTVISVISLVRSLPSTSTSACCVAAGKLWRPTHSLGPTTGEAPAAAGPAAAAAAAAAAAGVTTGAVSSSPSSSYSSSSSDTSSYSSSSSYSS